MRRLTPLLLLAGFLSGGLLSGPALADVVHLKDGRKLEGSVIHEGNTLIVRHSLGSAHVHMSDVLKIEETADRWDELERLRKQLSSGDADDRYRFAVWAREHGFPQEAKRAFLSVLRLDLDHPGARAALGYVLHEGRWITRADQKRLEGFVRDEDADEWVKPEELAKREAQRKAEHKARASARIAAKKAEKEAKRAAREAKRQARRERVIARQQAIARARAWDRATSVPLSGPSWSGWTRSALLYPYGWGGTCNGYQPFVNRGIVRGRNGYGYNRRGVTYRRRGIGTQVQGNYSGSNWGLRWRIGY